MEIWRREAWEIAELVRTKAISAVEATREQLDRLAAVNPAINAIVGDLAEAALAQAKDADARQARGEALGPLHGVPVTTKITADQAGGPSYLGYVLRRPGVVRQDEAVIANLRAAGAIFVGRTTSPALGMRAMTSSAWQGLTLNPWDRAITCGGSSGGAAAATAVGIGAIAQGSDIGGSIRWPAYCNGVVGLRPSLGRVPSFSPESSGPRGLAGQLMGVAGPITRSVRDARLALEVMARGDRRDSAWVPAPMTWAPEPLRAALVAAPAGLRTDPAVSTAVRRAGASLAAAGYEVEEIEPPSFVETAELWHPIGVPELRLGMVPVLDRIGDSALSGFIRAWVEDRGGVDMAGYMSALARRDQLIAQWAGFLERFAVVVMPSCLEVALPAELDAESAEGALRTLDAILPQFICPVLGLPGLAVPVAGVGERPLGVQILAARFREDLCLAAGEVIEAAEGLAGPIDPRF